MILRDELPGEGPNLAALTDLAFKGKAYADGSEGSILEGLRSAGDLVFAKVAEIDGRAVGHVAFSPAWIGGEEGWLGLGPISVHPDHQRQGIGTSLMDAAIAWSAGSKGIVLLGDPGYYGRFGFVADCGLTFLEVPSAYVQALPHGPLPKGEITFAPALQAAG
ncbi:MAG: N-acetyltransferase [Pseudomonadota bacterium]